ncbi:MAG: YdeI family protein [Actinomycetota bacterium]
MKPHYFHSAAEMRRWLIANHAKASEILIGFYKKRSGKQRLSWSEAVDQALCFGWIDGVRNGVDDERYTIRFSPRKPASIWSAINIAKVQKLKKDGLMEPAGLAAFAARDDKRSKVYAYEQAEAAFDASQEKRFHADKKAWDFFQQQAAWYQRNATWWVISAKRQETRERRLEQLIEDSARGRRLKHLSRTGSG